MIDAAAIALVQAQFCLVARDVDGFAADIHARLGQGEARGQEIVRRRHRVVGLALIVSSLDRLDGIHAYLADCGRRHAEDDVSAGDYAVVGDALIDTLAARLGSAFSADARRAWRRAYALVTDIMQASAVRRPALVA